MRVAYLADTPEIGGAERNLADLAIVALEAGAEVTVLAPQQEVVEYLRERVDGASIVRAGSDRYHHAASPAARGAALAAEIVEIARLLRSLRPDVVHVNNGGFPGSDLCRIAPLAGRLAGVGARAMSVHTVPWRRAQLSRPRLQSVADRLVWSNVDAVVCPARAVADGLSADRGMPPGLAELLHYGVAQPASDPERAVALRRRLAPVGEPLVGMVSNRAVHEKGYDVFIDALARVPEARGVIVGPHPSGGFIERVQRLGLAERLALEGRQNHVGPYYRAIDALAVPSTAHEAMPLVILEAMAAGRPAIGSRLSGIPEAIVDGENGRTFPPGDAGALAAVLAELVASPEAWAEMGEAGRNRWERDFTRPKMKAGLISLYRRLTWTPRSPRRA